MILSDSPTTRWCVGTKPVYDGTRGVPPPRCYLSVTAYTTKTKGSNLRIQQYPYRCFLVGLSKRIYITIAFVADTLTDNIYLHAMYPETATAPACRDRGRTFREETGGVVIFSAGSKQQPTIVLSTLISSMSDDFNWGSTSTRFRRRLSLSGSAPLPLFRSAVLFLRVAPAIP